MNWKKVLLIAFALVLTLGLVACNGDDGDDYNDYQVGNDNGNDAVTTDVGAALNIAIVTSPSGVDDGSFNQNNYEGVLAFIANNPDSNVTAVREPDMDNAISAVEQIVADFDVFVLPGFQNAGITPVAEANPDTKFILVDTFPVDEDGDAVELPNVYAMRFAEQESGFLAGIAAAMETETGNVAFVGGGAIPPVVNYHFGFIGGVTYANANLGTDATIVDLSAFAGDSAVPTYIGTDIGGNYIGVFNDPDIGKQVGDALVDAGVDIMFVAAGGSGMGAFAAAAEAEGVMVIGCDVDQFDLGGDPNVVLTSVLKVMDLNVTAQLEAIANGTFAGGNNTIFAGSPTPGTGVVLTEGRQQLSADTIAALEAALTALKDGSVEPAGNFSQFAPTEFPGL